MGCSSARRSNQNVDIICYPDRFSACFYKKSGLRILRQSCSACSQKSRGRESTPLSPVPESSLLGAARAHGLLPGVWSSRFQLSCRDLVLLSAENFQLASGPELTQRVQRCPRPSGGGMTGVACRAHSLYAVTVVVAAVICMAVALWVVTSLPRCRGVQLGQTHRIALACIRCFDGLGLPRSRPCCVEPGGDRVVRLAL